MNQQEIERFVMRYLDTTGCHIAEKGAGHVTVRLSPEADKDLMNRSYYWGFVERTGAPPEPMSFTFIFDPEAAEAGASPRTQAHAVGTGAPAAASRSATSVGSSTAGTDNEAAAPAGDSILGRYFGISLPAGGMGAGPGRIPSDTMTFGSRRLEQLFGVVCSRGRYVRLFEEPDPAALNPYASPGYSTWLCVNYKLEFVCDMKRDEMHSLGIQLTTGRIVDGFYSRLQKRRLTPQIPATIHLRPTALTLEKAAAALDNQIETLVRGYDHTWADEAWMRLKEEWSRIDRYYGELLQTAEPGKKAEIEEQYRSREQEIDWQYRPRILVSVTNCGLFHLSEGARTAIDASR